jgi:hypothetical protein
MGKRHAVRDTRNCRDCPILVVRDSKIAITDRLGRNCGTKFSQLALECCLGARIG